MPPQNPNPKLSGNLLRAISLEDFTIKASSAETASTTGTAIEVGDWSTAFIDVNVTAVTGTTPTLTVVFEGSNDLGVSWFTIATVGLNGVGYGLTTPTNFVAAAETKGVILLAEMIRYRSVIGGTTPSFTYVITATANIK